MTLSEPSFTIVATKSSAERIVRYLTTVLELTRTATVSLDNVLGGRRLSAEALSRLGVLTNTAVTWVKGRNEVRHASSPS